MIGYVIAFGAGVIVGSGITFAAGYWFVTAGPGRWQP